MSRTNVDARNYHVVGDEAENVSEKKKLHNLNVTLYVLLSHLKSKMFLSGK